jgi:hypothetical protein
MKRLLVLLPLLVVVVGLFMPGDSKASIDDPGVLGSEIASNTNQTVQYMWVMAEVLQP